MEVFAFWLSSDGSVCLLFSSDGNVCLCLSSDGSVCLLIVIRWKCLSLVVIRWKCLSLVVIIWKCFPFYRPDLSGRIMVLWYGVGVCPSVCGFVHKACKHDIDQTVSARTVKLGTHITYDKGKNPIDFQGHGSKVKVTCYNIVVKPCKHDTDWTISARTIKLGTQITYDKRKTPIDFQGHGSKVKVTRWTLLLNLVNRIQTEPFQLRPSNLVHRLLMTRGRHLLTFKVMGQRSRSHATHCC